MKKKLYVAYPRGWRLSKQCIQDSFNRLVEIAEKIFNQELETINDCNEDYNDNLLEHLSKEAIKVNRADYIIKVDTVGYGDDAFDFLFNTIIQNAFPPYHVCTLPANTLRWVAPDLYENYMNNLHWDKECSYCPEKEECDKSFEEAYNDLPTCSGYNDEIEGQMYFDLDAMFNNPENTGFYN